MSDVIVDHLTADELDALLVGAGSPRATSHLATCPSCVAMRELDVRVVTALGGLPTWEPSAEFADHIMAQVQIRPVLAELPWVLSARERSARRRVLVASVATGGALAACLAWAVAHPAAALGWSAPTVADAGQSLWVTLQTVAANTAEQPWFGGVRDALATPTRAFPVLVGALGTYALALVALRRLLTEPATDAGW
ncbi:MAG: hypothetical protein ABIZ70_00735 [Gemmatimonadales bacterium]